MLVSGLSVSSVIRQSTALDGVWRPRASYLESQVRVKQRE